MNTLLKVSLLLLFAFSCNGQELKNNFISAKLGFGKIESRIYGQSFDFGLGRHISKGLYGIANFSKTTARNDRSDLLTDDTTSPYTSTPGDIMIMSNYSLGLKKYIRLGPSLLFAGSLSALSSSVSQRFMEIIEENKIGPVYAEYKTIGARINIEAIYFVSASVSFNTGLQYNTSPQLMMLNLGANTWF